MSALGISPIGLLDRTRRLYFGVQRAAESSIPLVDPAVPFGVDREPADGQGLTHPSAMEAGPALTGLAKIGTSGSNQPGLHRLGAIRVQTGSQRGQCDRPRPVHPAQSDGPLRHTHATLLLKARISVKVVQERWGMPPG